MKFKKSVDINQSLEKVVTLFKDSANLKYWQEGFVKKVLLEGNEGEDGAVSMLYYESTGHKMELRETIISNDLPNSMEAFYHHKHMDNTLKNSFEPIDENTTRYTNEVEYTRINWVMPRLMAILFPGVYRKPIAKWMTNFKDFAEVHEEKNTLKKR